MKKQNIILLVIAVILSAIAIYFIKFHKENTMGDCGDDESFSVFAVSDTASITRIFLADKQNNSATIERKGDYWTVNEKFRARKDAVDMILKTIKRIEFKNPVSKAARENVIRLLSGRSTKVEIYAGKKLLKTYYVGDATKDQYGTYMLLEIDGQKACTPAIVHIPGFAGYLSSRFFTGEFEWRDKNIFSYNFNDIRSVKIQDNEHPKESYIAFNNGNNNFDLQGINGEKFTWFDTIEVKTMLGYYKKVNFENFLPNMSQQTKDSILATSPFKIITLTDNKNKSSILKLYRKQNDGLIDFDGNEMEFDPDRLYAYHEELGIILIQYYVFDPLTLSLSYLLNKPEV
ncbi:MAG: DUF4340 domain-containing protein [Bacteroidales bacterium]|nr:DUF4340 domain-containing protein [Bacteroidales bacterium]